MQLRQVLQSGLRRLLDRYIPSPQLAAELLLMHLLDCDRSYLYSHPEIEICAELAERYFGLIAERCTGKPTQYITGHQEFWGLDFEVTPDVLIPRPETEHIVEAVLDLAPDVALDSAIPNLGTSSRRAVGSAASHQAPNVSFAEGELPARGVGLHIIDVGTGSGCIALALASELRGATLFATDISRPALDVAKRNARRLALAESVRFVQCNLLNCFRADAAPCQTRSFESGGDPEILRSAQNDMRKSCHPEGSTSGLVPSESGFQGSAPHPECSERSPGGGAHARTDPLRSQSGATDSEVGHYPGTFDFIVSNPPYVGHDELDSVQREVRDFEPRLAWGGLSRGEEVYCRLIPQALTVLRPGGYLVVEIGYSMGDKIRSLLRTGWNEVQVRSDLAGIPRVVTARKGR